MAADGLVLVRGVGFTRFVNLMTELGPLYQHPDAGSDGVTRVVPDGKSDAQAGYGFSAKALGLHTDRSSMQRPPRFLGLYLEHQPSQGGVPLFADLHVALKSQLQQDLEKVDVTAGDGSTLPMVLSSGDRRFRYRDDPWWHLTGPDELVSEIRDSVDHSTFALSLTTGDAYVLDNHRVLHGRTAITDAKRVALRILVDGDL